MGGSMIYTSTQYIYVALLGRRANIGGSIHFHTIQSVTVADFVIDVADFVIDRRRLRH